MKELWQRAVVVLALGCLLLVARMVPSTDNTPQSPSSRLPELAFSDTSPFLWDIEIIFLGDAG